MKARKNVFYKSIMAYRNNAREKFRYSALFDNVFFDLSDRALLFSIFLSKSSVYNTKFKAGCLATGRMRGTLTRFIMSRMVFKTYAISALLPGVRKSRW